MREPLWFNHTFQKVVQKRKPVQNHFLRKKKERVDKQYYVDFKLTKEPAKELMKRAEEFLVKIKFIISNNNIGEINEIREKLKNMIKT